MKNNILFLITTLFLSILSNQSYAEPIIKSYCGFPADGTAKCGAWNNQYQGNAALIGVRVQQYPDSECEGVSDRARSKCLKKSKYTNAHPSMINYVFKDCRVNQMGFNPDGEVKEDFWWRVNTNQYATWEAIGIKLPQACKSNSR